jgi:hypothetical protein
LGGVRQDKTVGAALRHFHAVLSSAGPRVSNPDNTPDALNFEIQRFDDYLRTASGLQEATRTLSKTLRSRVPPRVFPGWRGGDVSPGAQRCSGVRGETCRWPQTDKCQSSCLVSP